MQKAKRMRVCFGGLMRPAMMFSVIWIPLTMGLSAPGCAQGSSQEAARSVEAVQTVTAAPVIPQQVRYAGKLATRAGDTVEAVFRIYAVEEGGQPLWTETQRVTVAEDGSYTILLGAASSAGLPQTVFAGGAARWLGVSVERGAETERVMLASVPYAMKSADAEALAGHKAADFVTQEQLAALAAQTVPASQTIMPLASGTVTGSGTTGTVPLWTGTNTQGNSEIVQVGSDVGINEATPVATLDVGGSANVRGELTLPPVAVATTASGHQSQLLELSSSAWSTTANAAVPQSFQFITQPTGNNTATPGGQLYLAYQNGTAAPTNLLSITNAGLINFASGQLFPGTITGVIGTSPIIAGVAGHSITVGLSTSALETTLNNVYAQSGVSNTFHGSQTVLGGLDVTGVLTGEDSVLSGSQAAQLFTATGAIQANKSIAATSSAGVNSPFVELDASSYSSSSSAAVPLIYAWQAQATGNNTAFPAANLALLYQTGTGGLNPTGLSISPNGNINFSSSQVFPIKGTGGGTITGITTSSPLTGGGTTGSVALALNEATLASDITPTLESTLNGVYAQLGQPNTFTTGQVIQGATTISGSNESGPMLDVANSGDSFSTAITLSNGGQYGVGLNATSSSDGIGIEGFGTQTAGSTGVLGALANSNGFSNSYFLLESDDGLDAGIWADGADGQEAALIATSDDLSAGIFFNDSSASSTILVLNNYSGGPLGNVAAGIATAMRVGGPGGMCGINQTGNLSCTGQMKSVVASKDGSRQLETYTVQSAENWMEDYGSGQLTNGSATIQVDAAFAETANTGVEFHVFLTPGGDCKGLYVANKTAGSFEVHELGGGTSSIAFDYKIVAKRNGLEAQRLVDVTERMKSEAERVRFKALDKPLPRTKMAKPQRVAVVKSAVER